MWSLFQACFLSVPFCCGLYLRRFFACPFRVCFQCDCFKSVQKLLPHLAEQKDCFKNGKLSLLLTMNHATLTAYHTGDGWIADYKHVSSSDSVKAVMHDEAATAFLKSEPNSPALMIQQIHFYHLYPSRRTRHLLDNCTLHVHPSTCTPVSFPSTQTRKLQNAF